MATSLQLQALQKAILRKVIVAEADAEAAAGTTVAQYIEILVERADTSTGPVLIMLDAIEGKVPTSIRLDALAAFAQLQFDYYASKGVAQPELGPYEALGKALSSTAGFHAQSDGKSDGQFIVDTYVKAFGVAPGGVGTAQVQHFLAQIEYFKGIYIAAGIAPADAALQARGAVYGQIFGTAAIVENSPLDIKAENFERAAANGTAFYDAPLAASQPPGAPDPNLVPHTFILTTAIDGLPAFQGNAADNTFIGTLGNDFFTTESTLNLGDKFDGGTGGNNTFKLFINPSFAGHNAVIDGTNIQHLWISNQDIGIIGNTNNLNVSAMTKLKDVTLSGDAGGAVTVLQNGVTHVDATVMNTGVQLGGFETLTIQSSTLDAKTTAQNLTLSNTMLNFNSFDISGHYKTYNIVSNGVNTGTAADPVTNSLNLFTDVNTTLIAVAGTAFIDIEFNGDPGDNDPALNGLKTFDATLASGGVKVNLEGAMFVATINFGDGNDTVSLPEMGHVNYAVNMGAGDDIVNTNGALTAGSTIDGGTGTNTIIMEDGNHLVNANQVKNFQWLDFTGADTGGTEHYNTAFIGGLQHIILNQESASLDSIFNDVTFDNVAAGVDLTLSGSVDSSYDITVNVFEAALPTHVNDAFTTNFASTSETVGGVGIHSLEIESVEFLTFNSTSTQTGELNELEELTDLAGISITINATTAGFEISELNDTSLRVFDATGSTKTVDINFADGFAAETFTYDDPTTHFSTTFLLGSGGDKLDLLNTFVTSTNGHMITSGVGGDEIILSTQAKHDVIIYNNVAESLLGGVTPPNFDTEIPSSATFDTIRNFSAGAVATHDTIDLSAFALEDPNVFVHGGGFGAAGFNGTLTAYQATHLFESDTPGFGDFGVAVLSDGAGGSWLYVHNDETTDAFNAATDMAIHVIGVAASAANWGAANVIHF